MPVLVINGRRVRVDEAFTSLSRAEQDATVDEIAGSMGVAAQADREPIAEQDAEAPKKTGMFENLAAAANEVAYGVAGLPVDLPRMGANFLADRVNDTTDTINRLAGSDLIGDVPKLPDDTIGSAKFYAGLGEKVGVNNPDDVVPGNDVEGIARGVASGVASTLVPELAVARVSTLAPKLAKGFEALFGSGKTTAGLVRNATIGGAAGGSSVAASESDLVPDWLKPTAAVVGGVVGGGAAGLASELPNAAGAGVRAIKAATETNTQAGREQIVGRTLVRQADDPSAVIDDIDNIAAQMVPGSEPTTFQQTGDMGLGALERVARTRDPAAFLQRAADQNTARVAEIEAIQTTGAPEAVAKSVRQHVQQLETSAQKQINEARARAIQGSEALGRGKTADEVGGSIREALERQRAAAAEREEALWGAIDPDRSLALPVTRTRSAMEGTLKDLPKSAKPPSGEEAAIYEAVRSYRGVEPFREVNTLRTRLAEAMRDEMERHGRTVAHARMSQLNNALWEDIEGAVTNKIAADQQAVASGRMRPEESATARLATPSTGRAVFTPSGRRVDVDYEVIEADDAIASQLDDMRANPAYDAALQPRNRDRAASELQIARIAGDLQPERLGPSATAAEGAPILGPDGMVESGNARVLALRRAYQQGGDSADRYRRYLQEQNFDTTGFEAPILVRRRRTEMDPATRTRFAQEANASTTLTMSASERASSDATRLTDDVLSLYRGGDVNSADNREFTRSFLKTVADQGEEGAFTTKDGTISLDGAQRVRGALLAAAYDDVGLIEALSDAGDENIKAFGRAMYDLAGDVARVKRGVEAGRVAPEADISPSMVEAARFVQNARRTNTKLADAAAQRDAFDVTGSDALDVLRLGYGTDLGQRFNRSRFDEAMKSAISEAEMQTTEARLFGEPAKLTEMLQGALARYGTDSRTAEDGQSVGYAGPGYGESRNAGRGPGNGPRRPGGTAEGTGYRGVLEEPELEPNFDQAALDRLNEAREATQTRANTFDNRTLAPLTRKPSQASEYTGPSVSTVPGRIFYEGAGSRDAIRAYRRAVGPERAASDVRNFAADKLRKEAMREDMTLDPQKLIMFRRRYRDALSEYPNLNAQISTAEKASAMLDEVAVQQKRAIDDAQKGVLGRLFGLEDPEDVVRTVGAIFTRQDGVAQMKRVRTAIGNDKEGQEGLRKSIVEMLLGKMVGNTEAGTSGVGTIKADGFQTFVRRNKATLYEAGFKEADVLRFEQLAADVQRANRSISSVKLPGQSNTPQDALALASQDNEFTSLILRMGVAPLASAGGSFVAGPLGAFVGVVGTNAIERMQARGLETVMDLLGEALLDPQLARTLMMKVKPKDLPKARAKLGSLLAGAQGRTAIDNLRDKDRSSIPALLRKGLSERNGSELRR